MYVGRKHVPSKFRDLLSMFVATHLLYGRLNHVMFLFCWLLFSLINATGKYSYASRSWTPQLIYIYCTYFSIAGWRSNTTPACLWDFLLWGWFSLCPPRSIFVSSDKVDGSCQPVVWLQCVIFLYKHLSHLDISPQVEENGHWEEFSWPCRIFLLQLA